MRQILLLVLQHLQDTALRKAYTKNLLLRVCPLHQAEASLQKWVHVCLVAVSQPDHHSFLSFRIC